jgi:ferredoxin
MSNVKIVIDESLCTSNGACVYAAPDVFSLNENRIAVSKNDVVPDHDDVRAAAESCPVAAITLFDPISGEEIL